MDLLNELVTDESDLDDVVTGFVSGEGSSVAVFFASPRGQRLSAGEDARKAIEQWLEQEGLNAFFEEPPD
jgi:hypothetical protein